MIEMTLTPLMVVPPLAKIPIRLEPISPPTTISAITRRLIAFCMLSEELIEPLVHEADLDLAVSDLLHEVVELVRHLGDHLRMAERLAPGTPRDAMGAEPLEHQVAGVRPRYLEDIEVRIELGADRREGCNRAVEQEEARGQVEIQRVDQLEALADDLDRIDLAQARAVVAVVQLADLGEELPLAVLRIAHAQVRQPLRNRRRSPSPRR